MRTDRWAPLPAAPRRRTGFALEVVLLMLVMFSVIVLAGLSAVTTISRTSNADYRGARASYAAEGAGDDVMSQLDAAMQDGIIDGEDIAGIQRPELSGFRIEQSTRTAGVPVSRTITSGPFAGLYALNQPIDIEVSARDSSGNRARAVLSVNAQTIPLFQFGVFYEDDLEILPGQPLTFAGWVHSNGNIYLSSNSATFQSNVTTPDSVFWQRKDRNERLNGVFIHNATGTPVRLDFDSRSLAGASFKTRSEQLFNGRLMTSAYGVRPLKLPLPSDMAAVTLVLPRDHADPPMVRDVKMAWKSDWHVTVDASALAAATPAQAQAQLCSTIAYQRTSGLDVPDAATCAQIFRPVANAFYEGREDLRPDLIDIHLDALRQWTDAAPATRTPRILYVQVTGQTTAAANDYVAVRLRQGAQLPAPRTAGTPGGLTIATDRPLYVLGDFNTTNWRPAALMGDAITFLSTPPNPGMVSTTAVPVSVRCTTSSTGWCDGFQQNFARRPARETTVNAALLVGHSATSCDYARGCGTPTYGGGLENLPRFLESWSGVVFRYNGSLVSLYRSRFATGLWGNTLNPGFSNGSYYDPPTRQWAFDINFRFPDRLPPGTPSVGTVIQTAFRPLY
jgi:hypothetical protein